MKIVWSPLALTRVHEIAIFISENSVVGARKWVNSIFASVKRLEKFPESGRWVPEVNRFDIREIVKDRYRIIYRVKEKQIAILTVRHGRERIRVGEIVRAQDFHLPDDPKQGLIMH